MATETRHHRHTKWFAPLAIVVLAGGALFLAYRDRIERCGSLRGGCTIALATNTTMTNTAATNSASNESVRYTDEEFPVQLEHPGGWTESRNATGEGKNRIVNVAFKDADQGVTLVIVDTSLEGIIRESYSTTDEQEVTMNGNPAKRLIGASAKDGSRMDLLFFTKDGTLYVLNGPATLLDRIGATIIFTK